MSLCLAAEHSLSDALLVTPLLERHGISRLPEVQGDRPVKKRFKSYPIGYFHIDIAEMQTAQGKLYLFVAIDRTSKFAFTEVHTRAGKMVAAQFLRNLVKAVPYSIYIRC